MAASARILLNHNFKRCVSTTPGNFLKYAMRQGRFMKKLMVGETGKRKWHMNEVRPPACPVVPAKILSNHVTRRMTVLNKIFMQHITDLMATGEESTELLGRGIEISHVKITPNFKNVLVFWSSKNENLLADTEKILRDCAFRLRHELTQLRVIGQVPMIVFVKDKRIAVLGELEKRLKIADYGDDYEPISPAYVPKHQFVLTTKLPPDVREKILQLKDTEEVSEAAAEGKEDDAEFDVNLPPMRHDVLGLDHYAIMTRVKVSLNKSRESTKDRLDNVLTIFPMEKSFSIDAVDFRTSKEDRQAFVDFLSKRQRDQRRKDRRDKRDRLTLYNLNEENNDDDDGDEQFMNEERDIDPLEDVSLESLK